MGTAVMLLLPVGGTPTVYIERTNSNHQESTVRTQLANGRRRAAFVSRGLDGALGEHRAIRGG
jgi:hypothetical protein